jgi:Uma2 family endonuclease
MASVTSATSSPAPLGDYPEPDAVPLCTVPDDRLYEVVDGHIVELPPMGCYESDIANLLAELLHEHLRKNQVGRAFLELLFRIDAKGKLKRRPDLAFVSAKKWPVGKRVPKGEAWDMVPDLAVEVVSESNPAQEVIQKVVDYLSAGSRLVWVVYPDLKQVHVYTDLTSARILTEPAELDGGNVVPGFRLSLTELFEDADSAELAPAGD